MFSADSVCFIHIWRFFRILFIVALISNPVFQGNCKFTSFSLLTFYFNSSVHHINILLYDRHSQTCSRNLSVCCISFPGKSLKERWKEFFAHSDTCINYLSPYPHIVFPVTVKLCDPYGNSSPWSCIFYRITDQIEENFLVLRLIADYVLMLDIIFHLKVNTFFLRFRLENFVNSLINISDLHIIFIQFHLTAFNPGHVQHIIDNRQKQISGLFHLLLIIQKFRISQFPFYQLTVSQQGIHGCPDIVRHIEKELWFGGISLFCLNLGFSRLYQQINYNPYNNQDHTYKPNGNYPQIILYVFCQSNLARCVFIYVKLTGKSGIRQSLNGFVQDIH